MPGDLENVGFDIFPSSLTGYSNKIYGNGGSYVYKDLDFNTSTKKFTNSSINLKVPAETDVALAISKSPTFKNKLKNIVIYQETHHGYNNAKDAVDILGLNRKDIYAIATYTRKAAKSSGFLHTVSYYYSLGNIPASHKLRTGNGKNGIKCDIKYEASVICGEY